MRPRCRIGLALAGLAALAACGSDRTAPPPPVPGDLRATLVSPNGAEGAAVVELIGSGLGDPRPEAGRLFAHHARDTLRVIVVLESAGAIGFAVSVPDVNRPPAARVVEVADGLNGLRASLGGYRVDLTVLASAP